MNFLPKQFDWRWWPKRPGEFNFAVVILIAIVALGVMIYFNPPYPEEKEIRKLSLGTAVQSGSGDGAKGGLSLLVVRMEDGSIVSFEPLGQALPKVYEKVCVEVSEGLETSRLFYRLRPIADCP